MNVYMEGWDDFAGSDSDQTDTTYRSVFAARNVGSPDNTPFITGRGGFGKAICAQDPPGLMSGFESFAISWKPVARCFIGFAWNLIVYANSGSTDVIRVKSGLNNVFTLTKESLTSFGIHWNTISSGPQGQVIAPWRGLDSYCEFGIDPAAQTIEVRIDGSSVFTTPPGVLIPGYTDSLVGTSSLTSFQWAAVVDDLYVNDDTGPYNNTYWGDVRIISLPPISDGSVTTMIPSAGTFHYSLVNEVPPNEDTTYVSATAAGQEDTYNFGRLPTTGGVGTVHALQTMAFCRTEFGGLVRIKGVVRSGGTDYLGPEASVPAVWTGVPSLFEVNPVTNAPWTVMDTGAYQFGARRTI